MKVFPMEISSRNLHCINIYQRSDLHQLEENGVTLVFGESLHNLHYNVCDGYVCNWRLLCSQQNVFCESERSDVALANTSLRSTFWSDIIYTKVVLNSQQPSTPAPFPQAVLHRHPPHFLDSPVLPHIFCPQCLNFLL